MSLDLLLAVFTSALAACVGLGAAYCPEPGALSLFLRLFLAGAALINLPALIARRFNEGTDRFRAYSGILAAMGIGLALFGFAPILRDGDANAFSDALLTTGALIGVAATARGLRREPRARLGAAAAAAALIALFAASTQWGSGATSLAVSARAKAGDIHTDHFYHSQMSDSIRRYGKVSIALDGLSPTRNHFLSHAFLAGLAKLCASNGLEAYQLLYPVVGPLLYLLALFLLLKRLSSRADAAELIALVSLATFFLPTAFLAKLVLWDPLGSESYGLGLFLFCAGLAAHPAPLRADDTTLPPRPIEIALQTAWVFFLSLCKISLGALASGLTGLWALWALRSRPARAVPVLVLSAAAFLASLPFVYDPRGTSFVPLYFIRWHAAWGWKSAPLFAIVHWLPIWIGFAALAYRCGMRGAARELSRDPFAGAVLGSSFLAALVFLNFSIYQGSGYYFTNLPTVLVLPWAVARLAELPAFRKPATLAVVLLLLAAPQWIQRLQGIERRVFMGEQRRQVSEAASAEYQWLLEARTRLSTPPCAVALDPWWLHGSAIWRDRRCYSVPFQFAGLLGRPLVQSAMHRACREGEQARHWHQPQGERPPNAPRGPAACRQARDSGLTCVEFIGRDSIERRDCPPI